MTRGVIEGISRSTILGKSPLGAFLRLHDWLWRRLPRSVTATRAVTTYGQMINALARAQNDRRQFHGTFFFRNRPIIELIRRLAVLRATGSTVRMAVLGCSNGAEVYSIMCVIRSMEPALKVDVHAVDISAEVLEEAQRGIYFLGVSELVREPIFERLTGDEMERMFENEGSQRKIRSWIKEGIEWSVGDAGDRQILDKLGRQDIVVANQFLCHMEPDEAERCLRNIARLVEPGGYLVVSGIDLDVRTKVANDLGWKPVQDLIEDIHEGDRSMRNSWPAKYWGLEPLDRRRLDWIVRYAAVFQLKSP
jgi:chemotaxis methyl-accepting protein methylase